MYSEHLNSKLRQANINPTTAKEQLLCRAASQVNTYVGLLNARLGIPDDSNDDSNIQNLLALLHSVNQMSKADPQCP